MASNDMLWDIRVYLQGKPLGQIHFAQRTKKEEEEKTMKTYDELKLKSMNEHR